MNLQSSNKTFIIQDKRSIHIHASPERVFSVIEKMPNKFPVYKIMETKPFFFLRLLLVDGWGAAVAAMSLERPEKEWILKIGDSMGPFQLTELERPFRYGFTLRSLFFNCRTGYSIDRHNNLTIMHFDLVAENPGWKEKIWWFFIKPLHGLFAEKGLRVIKESVESRTNNNHAIRDREETAN